MSENIMSLEDVSRLIMEAREILRFTMNLREITYVEKPYDYDETLAICKVVSFQLKKLNLDREASWVDGWILDLMKIYDTPSDFTIFRVIKYLTELAESLFDKCLKAMESISKNIQQNLEENNGKQSNSHQGS